MKGVIRKVAHDSQSVTRGRVLSGVNHSVKIVGPKAKGR